MFPKSLSRWNNPTALCAGTLAALLSACTASGPTAEDYAAAGLPPSAAAQANPDKLLVVDCLLPGQIRKLGSKLTYLTARRPIKTTAGDCELRGGEYVAYDRADYRTALKLWLPQAETGDPEAQTAVGEIYERGLGVPPDYAKAAEWYRKAAAQGYSRAQVNLGFLYEKGLGVNKNPVQAINLYRKASGLTGDQLAFSSSIQELKSQVQQLQTERRRSDRAASRQQQASQQLHNELQQTRKQLEAERKTLQASQRELEHTRQEIQKQSSTASAGASEDDGKIAELKRSLAEHQAQLDEQSQKMGYLQQEAKLQEEQLTARLRAAEGREQALRQEVTQKSQEKEQLQQQLASLQDQLRAARDDMNSREQALEAQRQELAQARKALEEQQQSAAAQAEVQRLEKQLDQRNAELAATKGRVAALETALKQRQEDLKQTEVAQSEQIVQRGAAIPTTEVQATPAITKQMQFGRYYALIIGNNEYAQFPRLHTAVNDAKALAKVLQQHYGFQTRLLLNADRYQILSALNDFREKLTENDNFLLYYAGHGELDPANDRGHWLPVDAEPSSPANWISNVQITDIINAMNAKHVMVITDSCYSGTLPRRITVSAEGGRSYDQRLDWLKLMNQARSRTALTSGSLQPVLDSGGGDHSLFAKRLLDILESNNDILEGPVLYQKVATAVRIAADKLNVEQDPQYGPIRFAGDVGAPFFFVPTGTGAATAKVSLKQGESG